MKALNGVGDRTLGQWEEWTGKAFHVRRRLTSAEENITGPAIDVRGTPEALARISRTRQAVPHLPSEFFLAEV